MIGSIGADDVTAFIALAAVPASSTGASAKAAARSKIFMSNSPVVVAVRGQPIAVPPRPQMRALAAPPPSRVAALRVGLAT